MDRIAKAEFIDQMVQNENAKAIGLTKKDAKVILDVVLDTTKENVIAGNKVAFTDFGTFEAADVKEREGRNPQTGEAQTIPAHRKVKFTPGKGFKTAVNE